MGGIKTCIVYYVNSIYQIRVLFLDLDSLSPAYKTGFCACRKIQSGMKKKPWLKNCYKIFLEYKKTRMKTCQRERELSYIVIEILRSVTSES